MAPKATKTALSKAPGSKLAQNLQRVSPGVYRNASGQLTNSGGRPMPGQPSRTPSPSVGAIQGVARGAGAAAGAALGGGRGMPQGGGPRGMLEGVAQGAGAAFGDKMGRPSNPNFQQQFEDMRRNFGQTDQQIGGLYDQARLAEMAGGFAGGMGQGFGGGMDDMQGQASQAATGAAQGFGQGLGMGMGGQQPSLEQQARSRAEAIARGDMVTADYNPEREALVNQMLPGIRQNMPQGMGKGPAPLPQNMGQGFGMGIAAQQKPGTVSGLLQRGAVPRPNPFENMMQGLGGKKPITY